MAEQSSSAEIAEIWKLFRETEQRFRDTDKRINDYFRETNRQLRKLEGLFTNQWGRLLEALVKPGVLKLFRNAA